MTNATIIAANGNNVTKYSELVKTLYSDGQGSGTLQGYLTINGDNLFVRKHWSYSGGFPVYSNESLGKEVGTIVLNNDRAYCEGKYQTLYDQHGNVIPDAELSFQTT